MSNLQQTFSGAYGSGRMISAICLAGAVTSPVAAPSISHVLDSRNALLLTSTTDLAPHLPLIDGVYQSSYKNGIIGPYEIRKTSDHEIAISELRAWKLLLEDWDGEGALAPIQESLQNAATFIFHLPRNKVAPEPLLHSYGHAGLVWDDGSTYGEIEFLKGGTLVYFFKNGLGKHKGEMIFDKTVSIKILSSLIPNACNERL